MVSVEPVGRRSQLRAFVDLPWHLYRGNELWVPPLKRDFRRLLDPGRHPFWQTARRELFLARRGPRVVGRIAAIVDERANDHLRERVGAWGFFECTLDPEAAAALFSAAGDWCRTQGMERLRGPLNPSTNYETGLLVEGFQRPPALMMPYTPPYYPNLVRLCGFHKAKDLYAFQITRRTPIPSWALQLGERLSRKGEVRIRPADRRHIRDDLRRMNRVYRLCWERNWGFTPMSDAEVSEAARRLVHVVDPDLAFFLVYREEAVGVCLILPDINPLLRRFNGSLGLSALIKMKRHRREVSGLRCLLFGVRPEFSRLGLPFVALYHLYKRLEEKPQYDHLELGWTLEDNEEINTVFVEAGVPPFKRYRIYEKALS